MPAEAARPQDAHMPATVRRLVPLGVSLAVGLSLAGLCAGPAAAGPAAFDGPTLVQAQSDLAAMVNDQRVAHGLVAVLPDPGATAMAVSRAETMASMDALDHAGPDGRTTFDLIRASGMTWFGAGEVIAYNTSSSEPASTGQAITGWLASPGHASIILSDGYNYAGFGAAVSASGNRYYAGVFLKLPDRTPGWVKAGRVTVAVVNATKSRVTVRWTGGDVRLQVLTAGLRDFEIQRRPAGGAWQSAGTTTHSSLSVTLARGRTWQFRVRSRDDAGNRSAWSVVSVRT
jgi:uncharacterized protein YkwD